MIKNHGIIRIKEANGLSAESAVSARKRKRKVTGNGVTGSDIPVSPVAGKRKRVRVAAASNDPLRRSEYHECKLFFEWAQHHPLLREFLIKNANEGKRTPVECHYLKLIGFRKGLPDYQLPVPNQRWSGLWIEMKRTVERTRSKRPEQIEWIRKLKEIRQFATFAYGWEDAARITSDYLNNII